MPRVSRVLVTSLDLFGHCRHIVQEGSHNSGPSSDEMTVPYSPFFFQVCLGLQHECELVWDLAEYPFGVTWHQENYCYLPAILQANVEATEQVWAQAFGVSVGVDKTFSGQMGQVLVRNGIFISCLADEFHVQPMVSLWL